MKRLAIRLVVWGLVALRFVVFGLLYAPVCWIAAKMVDLLRYFFMALFALISVGLVFMALAYGPWPLLVFFTGHGTGFPWAALFITAEVAGVAWVSSRRRVSQVVHYREGVVLKFRDGPRAGTEMIGFLINDLRDRTEAIELNREAHVLWLTAIGKLPVFVEGTFGYHFSAH